MKVKHGTLMNAISINCHDKKNMHNKTLMACTVDLSMTLARSLTCSPTTDVSEVRRLVKLLDLVLSKKPIFGERRESIIINLIRTVALPPTCRLY